MSKLLSLLALAGNGEAAISAACDDLSHAVFHGIAHGNAKNLSQTIERLAETGAKKDGAAKAGRAGTVYGLTRLAASAMQQARGRLLQEFPGHKGAPSPAMKARAEAMAQAIASEFEAAAVAALAPKKSEGAKVAPLPKALNAALRTAFEQHGEEAVLAALASIGKVKTKPVEPVEPVTAPAAPAVPVKRRIKA